MWELATVLSGIKLRVKQIGNVHFTHNLFSNFFSSLLTTPHAICLSSLLHTHIHTYTLLCHGGQWKRTNIFLYQQRSGSDRRMKEKDEFKEGCSGLCVCVYVCVLGVGGKKEPGDPEEGERHNGREEQWNVAIPRTLHWGYIYWSQDSEGDILFFFFFSVINRGEVLWIDLVH